MLPRLLLMVLVLGCDKSQLIEIEDPYGDGGRFRLDAGSTPDPVDAGTEVVCACPAVQACRQPTVDRPAFAPSGLFVEELLNLIACAETSIQIAVYETQLQCVVSAVQSRLDARPGLQVEWILDDDQCPEENGRRTCAVNRLADHPRVIVVDDQRSRFMHHKFVVVDQAYVWTSSGNLTDNSMCQDYNDAIVIDDPVVVAAFAGEAARLMTTGEFGPQPRRAPTVSGPYTIRFGPQSPLDTPPDWHQSLIAEIDSATQTLDFAIFAFTREDVADALIAAKERGVVVRGLVSNQYVGGTPALRLKAAQIQLRQGHIHAKLLIIDGRRVLTGSPNWSNNAWRNNESSLTINSLQVAERYRTSFERTFADSDAP